MIRDDFAGAALVIIGDDFAAFALLLFLFLDNLDIQSDLVASGLFSFKAGVLLPEG
jgi:hypothetical protein